MKNMLQDINSLSKNNVHIKNKDRVNEILNNLARDGVSKLQIVSDFDKTITKQHENGILHLSSFGMFSKCPSVSNSYLETVEALMKKYYPLETDPTLPHSEKVVLMEEWWSKSEIALKGLKVSQDEIYEVCVQIGPSIRDGSKEFFESLAELKIPVLVFSAGLGDTIIAVLKHFNVLLPNVKVVSNFLKYDNAGYIEGFQGRLIHVFNKNEFAIKDTEFYNVVLDRTNVIVLGDSLGDASMADGMEHLKNVLKIGFLYDRIEESLPSYLDTFDIVLVDDQTMDVPKAILNYVKNAQDI